MQPKFVRIVVAKFTNKNVPTIVVAPSKITETELGTSFIRAVFTENRHACNTVQVMWCIWCT